MNHQPKGEMMEKLGITLASMINQDDPDRKLIEVDRNFVTIKFGGHDYDIELSRIKNQAELLGWVHHLCGKTWMNGHRIILFIDAINKAKGWKVAES
jgi:hypothetical protein